MFGYIRPYKPELKMREFETYKAVYCGLCHSIGRRYGFLMRMILSYDATFLVLLQLALNSSCDGFIKKRCPFRPLSKRPCCQITGDFEFSADVGVILFYQKLRDDLQDAIWSKKIIAVLLLPLIYSFFKKAAKRQPTAYLLIQKYMNGQKAIELNFEGKNIDQFATPTAEMMSELFCMATKGRANSRVMERLGYFLGRWVYFTDAIDDLEQDIMNGDFNPFIAVYGLKPGSDLQEIRKVAEMLLNSCIFEITTSFELLEFNRFRTIVHNIVYLGLPEMQRNILQGKKIKAL